MSAQGVRSQYGLFFILYFVFIYLNWTALWYYVKHVAHTLLRIPKKKPSHSEFIHALLEALSPKIESCPPNPTDEGCIVLANHVNWSDFVIDICLVERGCYVSRNVLWYVFFPGSFIRARLYSDCIFFKRGRASAKSGLYKQVLDKVHVGKSVLVYAEGTRNPTARKMPLKMGLVKLAYEQNVPVFVSMTSNKQSIFDELKWIVTFHVPITNVKSPVLLPSAYPDLKAFVDAVQGQWDALWDQLFPGS